MEKMMKHAILAAISAGALAIAVPAQAAADNTTNAGSPPHGSAGGAKAGTAASTKLDLSNLYAADVNNNNSNNPMANNASLPNNNYVKSNPENPTYHGLSVEQIQSAPIKTSGGDDVGSVNHVLADKSNRIVAVTTDAGGGFFGGFFGAGKQVAIPMSDLRYDSANRDFVTSLTKNEVKSLQTWNENKHTGSNGGGMNNNADGNAGNANH
jgi:hypothetical protein